ncbi:conserved hypothetical protein, cofD-related [Caloramator fervidus]|uniref:Putative gluconeogenesis factor n=1 Tax=Caloramator fervidus TaxID=29344 RepID=A0A1H5T9B5_9CLOT|nr:gluconeogenesis factor YvcK family protein [Caloramator fervidus]SEF59413.1 conserved hypothetical protein, cofD-related [Caloramator fervidus]
MSFLAWLKVGLNIKRWILLGTIGFVILVLGVSKLILVGLFLDLNFFIGLLLSIIGGIATYISFRNLFKSLLTITGCSVSDINRKRIEDLYEKKFLIRGPRIVAIGGGTGLSTMLRGLKAYTSNITAIVTVADDGGGSGILRETLGMLPPGDIRNCLVALANTEPLMEQLMQYRFKEGDLKGQSFGNLFIAAMNGISVNFLEAIKKMSDVLAVQGKVYPVTLESVTLCAKLSDGSIVKGESKIAYEVLKRKAKIERVFLEPDNPIPLQEAIDAINEADCIIIGPGSLYTSVLPNLVIKEVAEAIKKSKALKVYVSNIMTQLGETDEYKLSDHVKAIEKHCGGRIVDFIIANNGKTPRDYYEKYKNDGQFMVKNDVENIPEYKVIQEDLVEINKYGYLRHNTKKLAETIMNLILKEVFPKDKRRILDYYYLLERVRKKDQEV